MDLAGGSLAGVPGITIGHNGSVAWGLTNLMTDCVDLFVVRVDPHNPTRYRVGNRVLEMEQTEIVFQPPRGKPQKLTLYRTLHGPVITEVQQGVEAAVSLKWYGTLPAGALTDRTFGGLLSLWRARNVQEALKAGSQFTLTGQNLVVADLEGHTGWHATGAVPIRKG
jgi:penicillin amidase